MNAAAHHHSPPCPCRHHSAGLVLMLHICVQMEESAQPETALQFIAPPPLAPVRTVRASAPHADALVPTCTCTQAAPSQPPRPAANERAASAQPAAWSGLERSQPMRLMQALSLEGVATVRCLTNTLGRQGCDSLPGRCDTSTAGMQRSTRSTRSAPAIGMPQAGAASVSPASMRDQAPHGTDLQAPPRWDAAAARCHNTPWANGAAHMQQLLPLLARKPMVFAASSTASERCSSEIAELVRML